MPRAEIALPRGLGGSTGLLPRSTQDDMGVAVGWIAPHGLALPETRERLIGLLARRAKMSA